MGLKKDGFSLQNQTKHKGFYTIAWFDQWGHERTHQTDFKVPEQKEQARDQAKELIAKAKKHKDKKKPPTAKELLRDEDFEFVLENFRTAKKYNGGRHGNKASPGHVNRIIQCVDKILDATGWEYPNQVNIGGFEDYLYSLADDGFAYKTINNYISNMNSVMSYCRYHKIIEYDPLEGIKRWNINPKPENKRRDLEAYEISLLREGVSKERWIVYLTAMLTGLRLGELKALKDEYLDVEKELLLITNKNNKNRDPDFFIHIPGLAQMLADYIKERGQHTRLFKFNFSHASKTLHEDLKACGIQGQQAHGKVTFHSFRNTSVNYGIELTTDLKTLQLHTRHKSLSVLFDNYGSQKDVKQRNLKVDMFKALQGV